MAAKHALVLGLTLLSLAGWSSSSSGVRAAAGYAPPTERFAGDSAKGWQAGEVVSRQGSRDYGAVLLSLEDFASASGRVNGALVVSCAKGQLDVLVRWPRPISTNPLEAQQLQWRFDNGAPQSEAWMSLPKQAASVTPSPRDFLDGMRRAHRLVVRSSRSDGSGAIALTFDLDGGQGAQFRQVDAKQVADRATDGCS